MKCKLPLLTIDDLIIEAIVLNKTWACSKIHETIDNEYFKIFGAPSKDDPPSI